MKTAMTTVISMQTTTTETSGNCIDAKLWCITTSATNNHNIVWNNWMWPSSYVFIYFSHPSAALYFHNSHRNLQQQLQFQCVLSVLRNILSRFSHCLIHNCHVLTTAESMASSLNPATQSCILWNNSSVSKWVPIAMNTLCLPVLTIRKLPCGVQLPRPPSDSARIRYVQFPGARGLLTNPRCCRYRL